jgi:hypothetical protein
MLPKQENYQLARQLAVENLRQSNLADRAFRSGGHYREGKGNGEQIGLKYLGRDLSFSFPAGTITASAEEPISLREEIFILHYLESASGAPLTGDWISFSEIPGGAFYYPVFAKRCQSVLVKTFGQNFEKLHSLIADGQAEHLGLGDVGLRLWVLPRIPLGLLVWRGDEEFPAEGKVLFDSSVKQYLPVEDIVVLAETVIWKLVKEKNPSPQRTQSTQRKEL